MTRLLLRLIVNAVALAAAAFIVNALFGAERGINYGNDLANLLWVALLFGVLNALIKPALKLLTCPLMLLTLGIFTLVVNALMLLLTSALAEPLGITFEVGGFWQALVGAIIISFVSTFLSVGKDDK
ncbi:MAG: phage holin family protein [Caldilineales bacterium]|nr:phage holin family protein [Caldilineales bacterium]